MEIELGPVRVHPNDGLELDSFPFYFDCNQNDIHHHHYLLPIQLNSSKLVTFIFLQWFNLSFTFFIGNVIKIDL